MDVPLPLPVAVVGGLILMLLGSLLTTHRDSLQNQHPALKKVTKVTEFALLVGLTGAITNAVQNGLTLIFGSNLWGFLIGGGISALLAVYGERVIDTIDKLQSVRRRDLGMTFFLIGLIIEIGQLYITLIVCVSSVRN
ncbi:MAG TPA: hypothetical protein VFV38_47575 [Ktedonobacteraceae bacterium]|jgi:hypothetical protein|nr:hypothetical protein [Ktedonobacteraceae bacterium]